MRSDDCDKAEHGCVLIHLRVALDDSECCPLALSIKIKGMRAKGGGSTIPNPLQFPLPSCPRQVSLSRARGI